MCKVLVKQKPFQKQLGPCARTVLGTTTWLSHLSDQCWEPTGLGTLVRAKANFLKEASGHMGPPVHFSAQGYGLGPQKESFLVLPFTSSLSLSPFHDQLKSDKNGSQFPVVLIR